MNRTARIILATGVALSVAVPAFADVAAAAPTETTTTDTTITVRAGDSLAGLAWRHGVSLSALLRANSMELTSMLHPGDTLVIPAGASSASFTATTAGSATPAAAAKPSVGRSDYVVVAGDALSLIAWRHGVRLGDLLEANGLSTTSLIVPGQRLQIPPATRSIPSQPTTSSPAPVSPAAAPTPAAGTSSAGFEYVVESGDSLSQIAWRHGVSLGELLAANDIAATSLILPGQRLRIPSAVRPVATPSAAASSQTPAAPSSTTQSSPTTASASSLDTLLSYLTAQVGAPYKFFSAGPATFDCSGLVVAAFRQVGISVPHQSRALAKLGSAVDWRSGSISAGDLVFTSATDDPDMITHVGIALDSQRWIHAVGHGKTVTIGSLPSDSKIMAVQRIALP
jgi:peptidoglycan endopeptidase LytE